MANYVEMGIVTEDLSTNRNKTSPVDTLRAYKRYLEDRFLNETELYYQAESAQFLHQNPVTEYIKRVEARLAEERKRVKVYLHDSTEQRLVQVC
ncbi:cullin, partial [Salmonella sp. s51228]|uniref:cullin n=1 Tax=Salmonella sp. s51228 TaxID=3159652 RepID=UPI00397F9000